MFSTIARMTEATIIFLRLITGIPAREADDWTSIANFLRAHGLAYAAEQGQGVEEAVSDEVVAGFCKSTVMELLNPQVPVTDTIPVYQITVEASSYAPLMNGSVIPYRASSTFDEWTCTAKSLEHAIGQVATHINPELQGTESEKYTAWLNKHAIIKYVPCDTKSWDA